jgi:hypothetical protein
MRAEAEAEGVCNGLVRQLGGACVCVCVCVCRAVQCSAAQAGARLRFNSVAGFACLAVVQARVAGSRVDGSAAEMSCSGGKGGAGGPWRWLVVHWVECVCCAVVVLERAGRGVGRTGWQGWMGRDGQIRGLRSDNLCSFAGRAPLTAPCVRRAGFHAHARGLLGSQVCRRAGARRWRGKKERHDAQRGAVGEHGIQQTRMRWTGG